MSINFTSLSPSEHDNGVALGSLSSSGAVPGSFEFYFASENDRGLYRIYDDVLYLTDSWHYDTENSTYRSYTVGDDTYQWSSWGVGDITFKYTPTDGGNNWVKLDKLPIDSSLLASDWMLTSS